MASSDRRLIEGLKGRNADRASATDGGVHAKKPFPTVAAKERKVIERALGFGLPDLVWALYREVANGGFGLEYGIVGTKGGAKLDDVTLETCYRNMLRLEEENPAWRWPHGLLPLINFGCDMWSCVDCEYKRLPMILWDPNNLCSEFEEDDARLNWGGAFWDQGVSLKKCLVDWLAEEPRPEPAWPSDAWMKKRLGFTLPR